jgi:hypothetical protein
MRQALLFLGAVLLITFGLALAQQKENSQAQQAPGPIPADAAKKNPVKPTTEGLAEARKFCTVTTAQVSREDGDGKGHLADSMKLQLSDWRDPESISKLRGRRVVLHHTNGRGKMVGGEADRTKEEFAGTW